jgi:uncharacterized protein
MPLQLKPFITHFSYEPFKNDYVKIAKDYVLEKLKDCDCKIFIYGSRARGTNHRWSDLDIGIHPGEQKRLPLDDIQDWLNYESIVPFKIEIVDFSKADEKFKKHALETIIWWKE